MEAIIFLSIIITLFSIFVSCLVIRRVKKQIAEITDALADVKNGNGNRRILSATNELVAPLAYEINEIVVSCLISLEQLFIVSTCCYIAVLPVIVITTRKQDKFLSGVIFSFFYGFCGIFLADGNLINLYPMTTGLVFSNYAHDEKVVYYPALSTSVMVIIFIGTIILLKVFNRQHNDI